MTKLTTDQIIALAQKHDYDPAMLKAIIAVESGGIGFSKITGRIIIQFEPLWFKRECSEWRQHSANHTWFNNGVGNQDIEWRAFDDAFKIDPDAAMKSTSIGMMQVMGFHYDSLGFKTVGEMWDYAKESEANQVDLAIRFIKSNPKLDQAVKDKNCALIAYYYNGSEYEKYNYDKRLSQELKYFSKN
jgi:hypothetical protein